MASGSSVGRHGPGVVWFKVCTALDTDMRGKNHANSHTKKLTNITKVVKSRKTAGSRSSEPLHSSFCGFISPAHSSIASSYDNNFVISFSVERIES